MGYTDSLGYEPESGAVFVAIKEDENICITRRFDEENDAKTNYPKHITGSSRSDASGKLITTGTFIEYLVKYDGKKWRKI